MSNLEIAKQIIKENYDRGNCGLFDTRNIIGDEMTELYNENGLKVDICYRYSYFEVFGLSSEEMDELGDYYRRM